MSEQDEVVYEEVVLEELKNEETELKGNPTFRSRNIPKGGADAERANHPCGLLLIIVGVALLLAVSSAAITAIVLTMNFDSRLREMARNISSKHGEMDQDITNNMQHNEDAITSLREESMQQHKTLVRLNTTLLKHGAQVSLLNDSTEDVKESVKKLIDSSRRNKDLTSNVQQNVDAITSLREESEQQHKTLVRLNTTLLKHGAQVSLLNDSLEAVKASVEKLTDNSRRYKDLTRNVQQNEDAITSLREESEQQHKTLVRLNTTLLKHGAQVSLLNDSLDDVKASVEKLIDSSRRYKVCLHGGKNTEDGLCECPKPYYGAQCETVYMVDCYDIKNTGKPTGIYEILPLGLNKSFQVYCDMDTAGGGWTVFQYRYEGSVEFYRNFTDYTIGFGSLTGEFWLGLQYIHVMTSSVPSMLRIDVAAADGTTAYQTYDDFNISEGPDYILNIGATSGTAGDESNKFGISWFNGLPFTTYDRDRDGKKGENCAKLCHGAWWYNNCGFVNPNGDYPTPGTTSIFWNGWGGMIYNEFKGKESLKSSKIMFRRT